MKLLLKSRYLQISVVSASLVFFLWLSATMWINAFTQYNYVQDFKKANLQEEIFFELASALGAERNLAYSLFSSVQVDPSGVETLRKSASNTDSLAMENEAFFHTIEIALQRHKNSGHNHGHQHVHTTDSVPQGGASEHPQYPQDNAQDDTIHSIYTERTNSDKNWLPAPAEHQGAAYQDQPAADSKKSIVKAIIEDLRNNKVMLYQQLDLEASVRQLMYGMMIFHEYTSAIDAIDGLRHSLHTTSGQSLPEHYIITRLKDSFWIFRESLDQISALLQGIAMKHENSQQLTQISHYTDMLTELNVKVDISWTELLKTIRSSSNPGIVERADVISNWYNSDFRMKSIELTVPSQFSTVSLNSFQEWLSSVRELSAVAEDIRLEANELTATLIANAEHRTATDLIQVSILVMVSLMMAIASALFFRRVDILAHQDDLTGLANRRLFSLNLTSSLAGSASEAGILMIDLDRFKYINDTLGHEAGDKLLKEVSQRLISAGVESSSISRLGGDEFAMLFEGHNTRYMESVAERIRQSLVNPFHIDGATLNIGSSIGIATYPEDAETPSLLLKAADLAMYCAKKSGTNQIATYDSQVDHSMAMATRTASELQLALKNDELELYYQPQFNLAKAQVLSVEALIRWNHPHRGLLTPNYFIPIAEDAGLMPAIGNWVIKEACRQAARWLYEMNMPLRVAVNISADHFFQGDFVKNIIDSLERHKLPPQLLEVEVTESIAMNDIKLVVESLKQLRDLSVHVALDDFGTGFSSLSYLQELPLDTLKIDKSFIQNMSRGNTRQECITETIVTLGNTLDLETVAEGVETMDQLTTVSDMRISVVQGFYYSRPVSAQELEFVVKQLNRMDHERKTA